MRNVQEIYFHRNPLTSNLLRKPYIIMLVDKVLENRHLNATVGVIVVILS